MKISICIPQYNRIEFLLKALKHIEEQTYDNIEVVISDDASTDNTTEEISLLEKNYRYKIIYHRFAENVGYDRNTRKSVELATGDYCFILGNDDTLNQPNDIEFLVQFLKDNSYPDIGFCNSCDYYNKDEIQPRAKETRVIGSGLKVALRYYSSFSFVAGIIYKKKVFDQFNTAKADKSIYFQLYLGTLMIAKNAKLFTIERPLVRSNIRIENKLANSYTDTLPKKWKHYTRLTGGLPDFAYVTKLAIEDAGENELLAYYKIIKRIYLVTYPFWLFYYREKKAFVAAYGLCRGLELKSFKDSGAFTSLQKFKLKSYYYTFSVVGLFIPIFVYHKLKKKMYKIGKRY